MHKPSASFYTPPSALLATRLLLLYPYKQPVPHSHVSAYLSMFDRQATCLEKTCSSQRIPPHLCVHAQHAGLGVVNIFLIEDNIHSKNLLRSTFKHCVSAQIFIKEKNMFHLPFNIMSMIHLSCIWLLVINIFHNRITLVCNKSTSKHCQRFFFVCILTLLQLSNCQIWLS